MKLNPNIVRSALFVPILMICAVISAYAQNVPSEKGDPPPTPRIANDDTLYVFDPAQPLTSPVSRSKGNTNYGFRVAFSGNGYGAGFFYQRDITDVLSIGADLLISGARNTSELEIQDPVTLEYIVPGKVNRLFILPVTVDLQYRLFQTSLSETLKPFLVAGVGPTFVIAAPYTYEFFNSFSYAQTFIRFGGFIGAGASVRSSEKNYISVDARYYIIPFGGDGIESIKGKPMKDFNGLFLSLSLGFH